MKYNFQNLKDVFVAIKENDYDRGFVASLVKTPITEDRQKSICSSYSFLSNNFIVDFFNAEQYNYSDKEFKDVILNLIQLEDWSNDLRVKSIIYKQYLKAYQEKLDNKTISYTTYSILVKKVLS